MIIKTFCNRYTSAGRSLPDEQKEVPMSEAFDKFYKLVHAQSDAIEAANLNSDPSKSWMLAIKGLHDAVETILCELQYPDYFDDKKLMIVRTAFARDQRGEISRGVVEVLFRILDRIGLLPDEGKIGTSFIYDPEHEAAERRAISIFVEAGILRPLTPVVDQRQVFEINEDYGREDAPAPSAPQIQESTSAAPAAELPAPGRVCFSSITEARAAVAHVAFGEKMIKVLRRSDIAVFNAILSKTSESVFAREGRLTARLTREEIAALSGYQGQAVYQACSRLHQLNLVKRTLTGGARGSFFEFPIPEEGPS